MIKSGNKLPLQTSVTRLIVAASLMLVMVACASAPLPPTRELQAAEQAINNAEQERVADFAPLELRQAHDKLAAARTAVRDEEMDLALLLAHESRVSAELASAKATESRAKAINDEMQQSLEVLQQELLRNSGSR